MPGTFFKLRLGERYLLRPGTHRVAAELAGYYPLDTSIEVSGKSAEQAFPLAFTKLPGKITLTTEPEAKAQVLVDGAMLGTTPLADAELTPGLHRIEFRADRYLAEVRELEVTGGGERQQLHSQAHAELGPRTLEDRAAGCDRSGRRHRDGRHAGDARAHGRRARRSRCASQASTLGTARCRSWRISRSSCRT